MQMREARARLVVETPRDPVLVHIDSDLMRQALLNLVLNAMQAMPEGGIVRVMLRREQHLAIVEVEDKGTASSLSCCRGSSSCTYDEKVEGAASDWR